MFGEVLAGVQKTLCVSALSPVQFPLLYLYFYLLFILKDQ